MCSTQIQIIPVKGMPVGAKIPTRDQTYTRDRGYHDGPVLGTVPLAVRIPVVCPMPARDLATSLSESL